MTEKLELRENNCIRLTRLVGLLYLGGEMELTLIDRLSLFKF